MDDLATSRVQRIIYQVFCLKSSTPTALCTLTIKVDDVATVVVEVGRRDGGTIGSLCSDATAFSHAARHGEGEPFAVFLVIDDAFGDFCSVRKSNLGRTIEVGTRYLDGLACLWQCVVDACDNWGCGTDGELISSLRVILHKADGVAYASVCFCHWGLAVEGHPDVVVSHQRIVEVGLETVHIDFLQA